MFVDTNAFLDLALAPWDADAALLLATIERGTVRGWVARRAITTVRYVVARHAGHTAATTAVSDLLRLLEVVPLALCDRMAEAAR